MSYGFEPGRTYNRRTDIHARYGGNQQAGIVVATAHNLIFIVSGSRGAEFGYDDEVRSDGTILYFGEGQRGDMTMTRGNRAIAQHAADSRSILLFQKHARDRDLTFVGEVVCEGWDFQRARDVDGNPRQAVVFRLRRLDSVVEGSAALDKPDARDLDGMRRRAYEAAGVRPPRPGATPRNIYERSADVRNYVLARASGSCEGCGVAAPFARPNGSPYLEPHHIKRVSDGGPDHPALVIALCPNCHRRVHAGADGPAYNRDLELRMGTIEPRTPA